MDRNLSKTLRRRRIKARLVACLGGECSHCGLKYDGANCALFDFHHRHPVEKQFTLSLTTIGSIAWETVMTEANKCDLLCANCHRVVHSAEY